MGWLSLETSMDALFQRAANAMGPNAQGVDGNSHVSCQQFPMIDLCLSLLLIILQYQLAIG